ncbi:hypothetical protein GCM10009443_08370 [Mucilaginibacter ginsenosidivorans]
MKRMLFEQLNMLITIDMKFCSKVNVILLNTNFANSLSNLLIHIFFTPKIKLV